MADDPEIVPARPGARVAALALVTIAIAGGVPLVFYTRRYLNGLTELAERDPAAALAGFRTWILPQVFVMAFIGISAGAWLVATGMRARRSGRFPPPGAWVVSDTPVRRGADARRIGVALMVTGAALTVVPVLLLAVIALLLLR